MNRNFSSSLYLGMRHGTDELHPWDALTTGVPAALFELPAAVALGKSIANLQRLADGVVSLSTLHLFWDWFGGLSRRDVVFADTQLYRVGAWGVERAAGKGISTQRFRHQCAASLQRLIGKAVRPRQRPIVVTDGWCPFCGKAAPLPDYLQIIEPFDGLLVVDDTQAMGVLGSKPGAAMPYGKGGGGLLRFLNLNSERIVGITSLAKAFGVPLAVLCGSELQVHKFKGYSETRIHCSPPSVAALAAGQNALRQNAAFGDEWRMKLLQNVSFFKAIMADNGFETKGGFFPVQTVLGLDDEQTRQIHVALWKKGIRTVSVLAHGKTPKLCWLLNARHSERDIQQACRVFLGELKKRHSFSFHPVNLQLYENRITIRRQTAFTLL